MNDLIGQSLGRYEICERLVEGGIFCQDMQVQVHSY